MKPIKQAILTLTLTTFLVSCGSSQSNKNGKELTGNIATDLKSLLPAGQHTADIMDGVRQSPRQALLTKKFQDGIRNNYEWFVEYMKKVPEGEPMPFHSNIGMTKDEFDELMVYINNIELVSTGKEKIEIDVRNDTIYFSSKGKLADLEFLKIDLKGNTVLFGQFKMPFADTSNITDEKNGLQSKWKGYTWNFVEPKDLDLDALKDPGNLKMKSYKFTIGRLEKNGKTYMSLKCREVEDGEKIVDFELPVIF